MDNGVKELIDSAVNYLFYSRIDTDKKEFYYEKMKEIFNNSINSYDAVINYYSYLVPIENIVVKEELLRVFKEYLLSTNNINNEEVIKLYLDNDQFHYLKSRINLTDLEEFLKRNPANENQIERVFSISPKIAFGLLDNVKNHSIDIEYYPNSVTNEEEFKELVKHVDAFTPSTISAIINSSVNFTQEQINELYPLAIDNSVSELNILPSDAEKRYMMLSKVNESLFKRSITNDDLEKLIETIKSKEFDKIPNGLKVNILKYSLTKEIYSLEDFMALLDNIEDDSISFASFSQYDKEKFNFILNKYLNKVSYKNLEMMLNLKTTLEEHKTKIYEYLVSNEKHTYLEKYARKQELDLDTFISIIDSKKYYIGKFKINTQNISKEKALSILTTPKYYSELNSMSLIFLLNIIDVEDMINIVSKKDMISLLNINDLAYLINLEFEDIINNDNIFEYYDRNLLLNAIEAYLHDFDDIEFLLNKNISKLVFNKPDLLTRGDIDSIKYLIDYTRNINRELTYLDIDMVRSYVGLYLTFGIEDSIDLINLNNVNPNIEEVIKIKDRLLQAKINTFRMENAADINNAFNMIMYNLERMNTVEDVKAASNYAFSLFLTYSDRVEPFKAIELLKKYVITKNKPDKEEELKELKEKIREQLKIATDEFINEKSSEYNQELTNKMKSKLKLKDSTIKELSQKYSKEIIIRNMLSEFHVIMNSNNSRDVRRKHAVTEIFKQKMNLYDLCDYEYFEENMLRKILNSDFDRNVFLYYLGYDKPDEYEKFVFNEKLKEEVNKINSLFMNNKDKELIFNHLLGKEKISKDNKDYKLIKEKEHVIKRFIDYLDFDGNKIVYNLEKIDDEEECKRYYEINNNINRMSKQVFTIMQSVFTPQKRLGINPEDLLDYFEGKIAINERNYEIVKNPLKTKEISLLFSNFDFSNQDNEEFSEDIKKFVFDNIYSIRFLSDSENQYYAKNFGYILSHYDKLSSISRALNIDINNITIEEVKLLQDYILLKLSSFGEDVDKKIISKLINETDYVEIKEASKRVEMGINLLEAAQKKTKGTIPLIKSPKYEILDYQDPRNLISGMINSSCFRVGGTGNDFISYCVLSKDGSIIFIKNPDNDEVIGRISAVRRGNTYFLHQLQINVEYSLDNEVQEMCERSIEELANDIIKKTADTPEPIEYVTITTFKDFQDVLKDKEEISKKECPYVIDPIDTTTDDYRNYLSYPNLEKRSIYNSFYHNYDACDTIIISKAKEAGPVKDYSAKPIYLRQRKDVQIYEVNDAKISIELEQKIRKILYLYYRKELDNIESDRNSKIYDLSNLQEVKLGEDWFILEYTDGRVETINLGYDERSIEEIGYFDRIEKEKKI